MPSTDPHAHCQAWAHETPVDEDELHCAVEKQLKNTGQRYTSARRKLIEVLFRAERPLTLPEIVDSAKDLAQSSAYRNLDLLIESGTVDRVISGHDYSHFEVSQSLIGHHHHLICDKCGLILDIDVAETLEDRIHDHLDQTAKTYGFYIHDHRLDIHGLCQQCQQQAA